MSDEHYHIIYGVDDGSPDLETSLAMLDDAQAAGITELWATPHMRWSDFSLETCKARFAELVPHAQQRGIEMKLGFEVFYKTLRKQGLHTAPAYVLEGTDMLLIEFNTGGEVAPDWERTVYRLQSEFGLEVTWAHPERYVSVWDDFALVQRMKDAGCRIQVSAGDVLGNPLGKHGKRIRAAKRILKEGLADALVSDAHEPGQFATFAKVAGKYWQ